MPLQISLRLTGGLESTFYITNVMKSHNSVLCLILIPQLFINDKQRTKKKKKERKENHVLCAFFWRIDL
jgi:hypothetical protein